MPSLRVLMLVCLLAAAAAVDVSKASAKKATAARKHAAATAVTAKKSMRGTTAAQRRSQRALAEVEAEVETEVNVEKAEARVRAAEAEASHASSAVAHAKAAVERGAQRLAATRASSLRMAAERQAHAAALSTAAERRAHSATPDAAGMPGQGDAMSGGGMQGGVNGWSAGMMRNSNGAGRMGAPMMMNPQMMGGFMPRPGNFFPYQSTVEGPMGMYGQNGFDPGMAQRAMMYGGGSYNGAVGAMAYGPMGSAGFSRMEGEAGTMGKMGIPGPINQQLLAQMAGGQMGGQMGGGGMGGGGMGGYNGGGMGGGMGGMGGPAVMIQRPGLGFERPGVPGQHSAYPAPGTRPLMAASPYSPYSYGGYDPHGFPNAHPGVPSSTPPPPPGGEKKA